MSNRWAFGENKTLFAFLVLLAAALQAGCATSPERSRQPPFSSGREGPQEGRDPFPALAEEYRLRACELEKKGDLPKALKMWEVVKGFAPGDVESKRQIASLKNQIPAAADRHFRKGAELFKNLSIALARREFLRAVYLKPDHAEALQYLKEKLNGEDFFFYEAKKGETLHRPHLFPAHPNLSPCFISSEMLFYNV